MLATLTNYYIYHCHFRVNPASTDVDPDTLDDTYVRETAPQV